MSLQQIQILCVDDEPDFADLTATFLERKSDLFVVETAISAEEGMEKLSDHPLDCIVSDYNMPGTDGIEFLQDIRAEYPDLPFILFTGMGSEAVARDAIAADVTDYLQKGSGSEQYELLANQIRNAVQARREAQRAERQEQLMRLTEFAGNTGGFELDTETGEMLLTDGIQQIIDLSDQANLSLDEAIDLYHPDDREDIRQAIDHAQQTGKQTRGTWRLQRHDGDERLVDVTFTSSTTNDNPEILRGAVHDITEQHKQQQDLKTERQLSTQAFDALDDLFYVIDADGTLQRWNETVPEVTGHSESELDNMPIIEVYPEDERNKVDRAVETTLTDGEATVHANLLTGDNQRVPYEFRVASLTDEQGNTMGLVWIGRDMTERRQRERRFRALVEESNDVISVVDADGRFQYQSPSLEGILGYDPEETVGDTAWEYIHPDDRETVIEQFQTWVANPDQRGEVIEYRARDANGSWHWMEANGNNQLDNSAVEGYVVNSRDITERKEREQELARNREFLGDIQAVADVGGWEVDLGLETLRWTDEVYRIFGLSTDFDPNVEDAVEFYHPDDRDTLERVYEALVSEGEPFDTEMRIETTDDNVRWVRTRGEPWRDDEGTIIGVRGTVQDITDQKVREHALRQKSRAVEAAPIGIVMTDPSQDDNPMTYVNQTFLDTSGYRPEEILGRNCRLMQGEDTDPETVARIREAVDAGKSVSAELRNYRKDSSEFWNHLEIVPMRDDDGKLLNFVGFQRDITERVRYERELEESRNRYQTLVENFPDGAVALIDEDLRYTTVGGTPIEEAQERRESPEGQLVEEALTDEMAATLVPKYEAALDGEQRAFEAELGDTVYRFRIVPVRDDNGSVFAAMGVSQDITELKERQRKLEKRERILRQLHVATRKFYPPDSIEEVSSFIVDFLTKTFEFSYVSVNRFDEQAGALRPTARFALFNGTVGPGTIEPGDDVFWDVYRSGESQILDGEELDDTWDPNDMAINQCLVVPIGDFGLTVVTTIGDDEFDDVDVDLVKVLVTNAQAVLKNLQNDQVQSELVDTIESQQETLAELQGVVEAIQAIQRRVTNSDSRDELEDSVCMQLVKTDRIDFAWIGRPQTSDTDLTATAWAGDQQGYLDAVLSDADDISLPAQHAATERDPYAVSNITQRVVDEAWAKDALSAQFRSVVSVPLILDDVLYGVLTAYSSTEDAFGTVYENLITDVASLVVTYSRILEQRYDTQEDFIELEFKLTDTAYPLQRLAAATGCRIEYDTVTESLDGAVRVLATVTKGDPAAVIDRAKEVHSVKDVRQFGNSDPRQVHLTVDKPFLALEVANHGGRVLELLSENTTTLRIAMPNTVSPRPLLDTLTNRYQNIDMIAQRQRTNRTEQTTDILTERQHEILNAAYRGGYYQTPRDVTGEDLAEMLGISGSTLYNHLQAAHRKVFKQFLEENENIERESGGRNN